MDTHFWWFFDAATIAVVLVFMYIFGRKNIIKTGVMLGCCIVSFAAAAFLSVKAEEYAYEKYVREFNISQIESLLDDNRFTKKAENILDERGYAAMNEESGMASVFVWDLMAEMDAMEMVDSLLSENLRFYIPDKSAKLFDIIGYQGFEKLSMLFSNTNNRQAAEYIEENYTAGVSKNIIRIICFIIILFVLIAVSGSLTGFASRNISGSKTGYILNHTAGTLIGAVLGVFTVFVVSAAIRVLISFGNDQMMFFNSGVIDETFLFRHIYKLTMKF